ncbi:hypothetical protein EMIT051CA3_30166 [Pseudomonas chlororaphis]
MLPDKKRNASYRKIIVNFLQSLYRISKMMNHLPTISDIKKLASIQILNGCLPDNNTILDSRI